MSPITPDMVARIIEKERPDAILPTMGGQTALNTDGGSIAKAVSNEVKGRAL